MSPKKLRSHDIIPKDNGNDENSEDCESGVIETSKSYLQPNSTSQTSQMQSFNISQDINDEDDEAENPTDVQSSSSEVDSLDEQPSKKSRIDIEAVESDNGVKRDNDLINSADKEVVDTNVDCEVSI